MFEAYAAASNRYTLLRYCCGCILQCHTPSCCHCVHVAICCLFFVVCFVGTHESCKAAWRSCTLHFTKHLRRKVAPDIFVCFPMLLHGVSMLPHDVLVLNLAELYVYRRTTC